MVLLVFLNSHDKNSYLMGRDVSAFLHGKGDYVKLFTRYKNDKYETCEVKDTLDTIREHARVFDKLIISFGLRLFPPSAYKDIIDKYKNEEKNIVFLKELKGSKTWTLNEGKLQFNNTRIADSGVFIFQSEDILRTTTSNFNTFLKELITAQKLKYEFVNYWIFTNKKTYKPRHKKRYKHKSKKGD